MSRPLRIQFENACYHVTCRGNGGQNIFLADYDRREFLELLNRSLDIYQVRLLAFVLMADHFHILVMTPLANLQEFMRHFNISYTSYFNRRHQRSGHLYQGRYKSFLIDEDKYLLDVSRYLHLNPLHAGTGKESTKKEMKSRLEKYRWSSYPDYIAEPRYTFLDRDDILSRLDKSAYRAFVEEGMRGSGNPLEMGKGHGIVGDGPFIKKVLRKMEKLNLLGEQPEARRLIAGTTPEKVLAVVAKRFKTTPEELVRERGRARGVAMEFLYRHAGLKQWEIGELMGLDYSSVSVARKRLREAAAKDPTLQKQMKAIENALNRG